MDMQFKDRFIEKWRKYFGETDPPMVFFYTDDESLGEVVKPPSAHQCVIGVLNKVLKGQTLLFGADSIGCAGGKRYLGYAKEIMPNFEHFLSCGIPGQLEGERYKKSPELVVEAMKHSPPFDAPAKYIAFKRWDNIVEADDPKVVIFFAKPDVLSGLFTLANFDEVEPNGVFAPFSAGCGSIVQFPFLEADKDRPRAVLGMFDVSARPFTQKECLSFAVPMNKFRKMIDNMDESFLITDSWAKVMKRIG